MAGLTKRQRKTFGAVVPVMLGVGEDEQHLVGQAVRRLDQYIDALPRREAGDSVRELLTAVWWYSVVVHQGRPYKLDREELDKLCAEFIDADGTPLDTVLDFASDLFGQDRVPSMRDLGRSLREMCALAFYSNPQTTDLVQWRPPWRNENVQAIVGDIPEPSADIDVDAIRRKHAEHVGVPSDQLFQNDGRPRVAVIGSGAGGAVAASILADTCDVAVFEAGPAFTPSQYPWDYMAGMALMLEDGLLTLNKNLDVHLFRGRLVGGSTVLTSGMTIETPQRVLDHWKSGGMGVEPGDMNRALADVKQRLRIEPVAEDRTSDPGKLWGAAAEVMDRVMVDVPEANVVTRRGQYQRGHGEPEIPDRVGERCVGCNLCNLGCHWGHHLSMDITYLLDAKQKGAKVHCNMGVKHLVAEVDEDTREVRVTGLKLFRDPQGDPVEVDYVVLAAGAIGSPALLLRSINRQPAFNRIPAVRRGEVGTGLGFNYGTTVVARFPEGKIPPGKGMDSGIIINFVGTKQGQDDFVLENAAIPPGLIASTVPGHGATHREWIRSYPRLGMAVNTIGSPQSGRVGPKQEVTYHVSGDEMRTIRESLAVIIKMYLHAGAEQVGLAGVRAVDDRLSVFDQSWTDRPEHEICHRLEQALPTAEHIMLSSAHPQGGLRMNQSAEAGVVGEGFRVHGSTNLFVGDASVIPSTIVVNPQWTVNALGQLAGEAAKEYIAARTAS